MRLALLGLLVACSSTPSVPIDTPENQWTWLPVDGTTCGNGSVAGMGVNRLEGSRDLFVYFEGGGACWDYDSCFTQNLAVNIDVTYDAAKLASDLGPTPIGRGAPFDQATLVFVPYCTGDLHAGDNVATYQDKTVHHTGATNTQAFVDTLRAAYPDARTVWVLGSSAGGYGATLNLHRFEEAWPHASIKLLQDSSPFVQPMVNYDVWQTSWDLQYPPSCPDCTTDFSKVVIALERAYPLTPIGLLTFDNDAVISSYFGYTSLVDATNALVASAYSGPTSRVFELAGTSHTMLGGLGTIVAPDGTSLATWVTAWATGGADWRNVTP